MQAKGASGVKSLLNSHRTALRFKLVHSRSP